MDARVRFKIIAYRLLQEYKKKTGKLETIIGYRNLSPINVDSLLCADDIVFISDSFHRMQD